MVIQEIRKETKDSVTLCFKQPGLRKIKYRAGQYLTINIVIDGRKYSRPYSFSSSPNVDSYLEVTVKRVSNGIVSNYINDYLKIGDIIEVSEPLGNFIYESKSTIQKIFLWGVGSGITPLFSLLKDILCTTPKLNTHLIYGNKNEDTTIFYEKLELLQKQFYPNFSITYFFSKPKKIFQNKNFNIGRIDGGFVESYLSNFQPLKDSLHYICGPQTLKDSIKDVLLNLDVKKSFIYSEDFNLVYNLKDFENVRDSNVFLFFKGRKHKIFVPKGKSILDAALDTRLNIPYSCQTGNCNTCRAKLKEGQIKMLGNKKERPDLATQEFLLCCSFPATESLIVEVN